MGQQEIETILISVYLISFLMLHYHIIEMNNRWENKKKGNHQNQRLQLYVKTMVVKEMELSDMRMFQSFFEY